MKIFDILKQQGLFSNDIKTRIKNSQITINGEPVTSDIELDVCLDSDSLEKFININLGDTTISKSREILLSLIREIDNMDNTLSKFNVKKSDLDDITFNEAKLFSNTAIIIESGRFISDIIKGNPIFAQQMIIFGFENLFDSNIKNKLTDILNQFILVKISKKDSFILKRK